MPFRGKIPYPQFAQIEFPVSFLENIGTFDEMNLRECPTNALERRQRNRDRRHITIPIESQAPQLRPSANGCRFFTKSLNALQQVIVLIKRKPGVRIFKSAVFQEGFILLINLPGILIIGAAIVNAEL